jgi:hypothetical protein
VLRRGAALMSCFLRLGLATSAQRNRPPYSTQSASKSRIVRRIGSP